MISVIIACAGSGKRMKVEKNKIFIRSSRKKYSLQYTCEKFTSCEKIDEIILVVAKHDLTVVEELATKIIHNKPYKVVVRAVVNANTPLIMHYKLLMLKVK